MKKLITLFGFLLLSSGIIKAQADCKDTPPDGLSPLAAYSIYHTNYMNGDYQFALKYGRWMMCAKPKELEGNPNYKLSKQFERLRTIYEEIGRTKEDPSVRSAYLDTVLILFDESLDLFGDTKEERFDIIFKKGRFYQQNYDFIEDGLAKAYDSYEKMFKLDAERALDLGNGYYMKALLDNLVSKGEKERAQAVIDMLMPLATGENLDYLNKKQEEMLGSPEEQITYYESVLADDPENLDALNALAKAYADMGNFEKEAEMRRKVHELNPTYDSALELGKIESSNAQYAKAATLYQQALDMAENDEQRVMLNMNLAKSNFNQGKLQTAKSHVSKVLQLEPNNGSAYIELARIYAEAVTQCTSDRKLEAQDRVVYWVVVDMLNKAKRIDPSVASTANNRLSAYEPVTPTSEDKFFTLKYENGQKVKVDGSLMPCYSWINETTTVR